MAARRYASSTHLPAGQKHPEERNATYAEVLLGLEQGFKTNPRGGRTLLLILIYCYGSSDLNYRLEQPNDIVRYQVSTGDWSGLLQYDQLKVAQSSGLAFNNFIEAPIAFQPTYKYDSGTSVYDTSEKARTPSWTDRVLWRPRESNGGEQVQSLAYTCSQNVIISDHKPVAALLVWAPSPHEGSSPDDHRQAVATRMQAVCSPLQWNHHPLRQPT